MKREEQLEQFDKAYGNFVDVVNSLSAEAFLRSLGGWTPRDIVAHLIGWNRNIRVGCGQIRNGLAPFYHQDALERLPQHQRGVHHALQLNGPGGAPGGTSQHPG